MGKKIALVQWAANAVSTVGVFFGHGPSSNMSTTSPSRRKSYTLNCSKPKPGPPAVSISTTRETPSASGFPQAKLGVATTLARPGVGNAIGLAGGGNATGGADGACVCAGEIGREVIVPVTSSVSATFVGMAAATESRTVSARPSVKLITPTATATAPAATKTVILRITLFPRTQKLFPGKSRLQSCQIG